MGDRCSSLSFLMDTGSLDYQRDKHNTLSPFETEEILILNYFQLPSSHTLVTWDREDDDGVENYLGKLYGMKRNFWLDPFFYFLHVLTTPFYRGYGRNLARQEEREVGSNASHTTICSHASALHKGFNADGEKFQSETSRDAEVRPPKFQQLGEGPSGPLGILQGVSEKGKVNGPHVPMTWVFRPSLCNDISFNAIEFTMRQLSLSETFSEDYQPLLNKSSSYLTNFQEVHMLRCLMVGRPQWENTLNPSENCSL